MIPNPFLGLVYHWLGGLASGSFYVPYRFVRKWSWETYWLTGGVFSWIIAPWLFGLTMTNDLPSVIAETPAETLFKVYLFGVLWGTGGLTFGLTMRYLGMSLGMAVALGYTAAFGTMVPPIVKGELFTKILPTLSGQVVLLGVLVCLAGIAVAGLAGMSKERELSEEAKKASIQEFDFKKGLLVATFSGVMSACFAFGLDASGPIKAITKAHQTPDLWSGLPSLVVILAGGFTTNFLWCLFLHWKNGSAYQYLSPVVRPDAALGRDRTEVLETATDAPGEEAALQAPGLGASAAEAASARVPLFWNYVFSALAGVTWYFQFFFYTMGETKMGEDYKFSSWTLHMASIMIFSTLWGIALKEWTGTSARTKRLVALTLAVLIASTVIIGYGNSLAPRSTPEGEAPPAAATAPVEAGN
ncbi:L-rhamnose/proton symporter RhaT [Planctomyces sp. SH-PL62]|uniref:L-rhamnose/proton symporter RhaT n=1 Tax=Planctomyces sp. SH-PL62 TaxID=1636152 RepID=UPI00078C295D|nr:L-rhamnose/proton symporter RhaT [Planctomyces sp. SH-PL62]AMV40677.1 L-rhamnose-proton symporter [Planctomyces sp. SH-PL62]